MSQSTQPSQCPIPEEATTGEGVVSPADLLDAIENLVALVELIAAKLGLDLDDLYST